MAISGVNDSAKEYENYRRKLQEQNEKHSEELETLKRRQNEAMKKVEEVNASNINHIREKTDQALTQQREDQTQQFEKVQDRFERQGQLDAKASYDRFGRAQDENSRELNHVKDLQRDQIENFVTNQAKELEGLKKSQAEEIYKINRQHQMRHNTLEDGSASKLDQQAQDFKKQITEANRNFQHALERQSREHFNELRGSKETGNLQMEKVQSQHENEVANLKNSFVLREKQLVDDKNLLNTEMERKGVATIGDYRNRLTENISRLVNDNNFDMARKDILNSNRLAAQEHEARMKQQDQKLALERTIAGLKADAGSQTDRDKLKADLNERRRTQENYLSSEGLRNQTKDTINQLNADHSSLLQSEQQRNQANMDTLKRAYQKRLTDLDQKAANTAQDSQFKTAEQQRAEAAQHGMERNRIIQEYERKQKALQDHTNLQMEQLTSHHRDKGLELHRKNEERIGTANQENQSKLFKQKVVYENMNKQERVEHKTAKDQLEKSFSTQNQRLANYYHNTLDDLQKTHGAQTEEMRADNDRMLTILRAEHDTRVKDQMLDFETKMRETATTYETRITDLVQNHERTNNALKLDHERTMRSMATRSKNELASMQENHKKEMALQENQYKEKMRLQEQNHREELVRIKRTNELLSKKS